MKKNKIRFLFKKNKQWKKAAAFVGLIILMIGGIAAGSKVLQEKDTVSAHPDNTITLDEGGENEFEVPVDGIGLREPALTSQSPTYDNHVQGLMDLPILVKGEIRTFWSNPVIPESGTELTEVSWRVRDVQPTKGGNYFVLLGASSYVSGGVIATAVINGNGDYIYLNAEGDMTSASDRLNTRLFSVSDGSNFLVGTNGNNFYRYTLSDETADSVTVNRTPVAVNTDDSPNRVLGVGYYQITDSISNSNDSTDVVGQVYFDERPTVNAIPYGLFKVPVANININGWRESVDPNFGFNTTHQYTLDTVVPEDAENISGKRYGNVVSNNSVITNDHVYGVFEYNRGTGGGTVMKTVQVFDKNDTFYENGVPMKRRKVLYENKDSNCRIYMLNELCTDSEIYFVSTEETESKLIKIELNGTYDIQELKTYPKNTILNFVENPEDSSQLFYFGSTTSLTGEFYHPVLTEELLGNNFYVQGITDRSFERQSIYAIPTDSNILPEFMKQGNEKALIFGTTTSANTSFVDRNFLVGENGELTEEDPTELARQAFIGSVESQTDYSPAIKADKNIEVDITNSSLNSTEKNAMGWTFLDNWLITGATDGTLSSDTALKVYDFMDSNDNRFGQKWLENRINRNPKSISADIDWEKLGFDKTKAGGQLVTYFVTDSQGQTSSISRWVNKTTPQTVEKDEYYLDAQNFHIPLDGVDTAIPDVNKFKELAQTMAWSKNSSVIDEDGTDNSQLSDKVTVNADQLRALQGATVAKPYPVDVVYTPKAGTEITNRVWVFVTTKNTIPNSEIDPAIAPKDTNGLVYYGDDYSLPFRLRGTQNKQEVLTRGNVKVYDYYDHTNETATELPPLADANTNANKLTVDFSVIQNATEPSTVRPSISYTWDGVVNENHAAGKPTVGYLDVHLTGHVLWHVRQVVLDSSEEIVVPTEGYFDVENVLTSGSIPTVDPDYRASLAANSGKQVENPAFTDVVVATDQLPAISDQVQLSLVTPEFYQYIGHYSTTEREDSKGASHNGNNNYTPGPVQLDKSTLNNEGEFWITLYIKPNESADGTSKKPQPYSWDYEKNDLGKIETQ